MCFPQVGTNKTLGVSAGRGGGEGTHCSSPCQQLVCSENQGLRNRTSKHLLQSLVSTLFFLSNMIYIISVTLFFLSNMIYTSLISEPYSVPEVQTGLTPNFPRTAGKLERKRHPAHSRGSREQPSTSSRLTFLNSVCLCFLRPFGSHC